MIRPRFSKRACKNTKERSSLFTFASAHLTFSPFTFHLSRTTHTLADAAYCSPPRYATELVCGCRRDLFSDVDLSQGVTHGLFGIFAGATPLLEPDANRQNINKENTACLRLPSFGGVQLAFTRRCRAAANLFSWFHPPNSPGPGETRQNLRNRSFSFPSAAHSRLSAAFCRCCCCCVLGRYVARAKVNPISSTRLFLQLGITVNYWSNLETTALSLFTLFAHYTTRPTALAERCSSSSSRKLFPSHKAQESMHYSERRQQTGEPTRNAQIPELAAVR